MQSQSIYTLTSVKEYVENWASGFKLRKIEPPISTNDPGLYVLGQCINTACTAVNQPLWVEHGYGTFYWEDIIYDSKCTVCKKRTEVIDAAIYQSNYEIDGELAVPRKTHIHKKGTVSIQKMKTIDQGSILNGIILQLRPLNCFKLKIFSSIMMDRRVLLLLNIL